MGWIVFANDRSLEWSMLLKTHLSSSAAGVVIFVLGPLERVVHVVVTPEACALILSHNPQSGKKFTNGLF